MPDASGHERGQLAPTSGDRSGVGSDLRGGVGGGRSAAAVQRLDRAGVRDRGGEGGKRLRRNPGVVAWGEPCRWGISCRSHGSATAGQTGRRTNLKGYDWGAVNVLGGSARMPVLPSFFRGQPLRGRLCRVRVKTVFVGARTTSRTGRYGCRPVLTRSARACRVRWSRARPLIVLRWGAPARYSERSWLTST
jgi:hypothetical protein